MELELDRYKKIIDEDFNTFKPINGRFVQLEKSWIRNISHQIMKDGNLYKHIDRKELRIKLLKYLNQKIKKPFNKNLVWMDKEKQLKDYITKRDKNVQI